MPDSQVYRRTRNNKFFVSLVSFILLAVVVFMILEVLGVFSVTKLLRKQPATTTPSTNGALKNQGVIVAPFPLSSPDIRLAGLTYTVQGQIRSIVPVPKDNSWRIVLEGAGGAYFNNPFDITEKTLITGQKDTKRTFKPQELQDKTPIEVSYYYNLKTKEGFVTSIRLTNY